ncbi:hypothetical protein CEXT_455461 [Caerostris extrusa]|uniref:Uncharacterized protein n=1 Tax=Caerostris extrusa TaxID=172846 RepID=A0AAV4U486_CAEEX|nr:hypothetical protein CEXT_455461 [Caerostris extrusa]
MHQNHEGKKEKTQKIGFFLLYFQYIPFRRLEINRAKSAQECIWNIIERPRMDPCSNKKNNFQQSCKLLVRVPKSGRFSLVNNGAGRQIHY